MSGLRLLRRLFGLAIVVAGLAISVAQAARWLMSP